MFKQSRSDKPCERVLIASANADDRRRVGDIARAAELRAVGFVREADQVISRTLLSMPDVLLLDVALLRQVLSSRELCAHLSGRSVKTVLFGERLTREAVAQRKTEGFHGALDIHGATESNLAEYAGALHQAVGEHGVPVAPAQGAPPASPVSVGKRKVLPPSGVVIGSSTGGPVALMAVLKALPASFPLPVAIVQHMPPGFTEMLAERLDAECALRVVEARAGMPFEAGSVLIAPGGSHMVLEGTPRSPRIGLNTNPPENSCRPSVDVLFRSSAQVFSGNVHAIVLTGMGRDGLTGASQLYSLGSRIVVQDATTSTVWGMPGAIAQAGFADDVLPLDQIAPQLLRCL